MTTSGNCSPSSSPLHQSGRAELCSSSCQHAVWPLGFWLLWVEVWPWRESPRSENPTPGGACLTTLCQSLYWDILRIYSLSTNQKIYVCQAAIPCQFESTSLTFIFLRSHLSCYQLGSNLVDQWRLWRCTDLFFSGIDKPVSQDPQLRLGVWLTEGCEISESDKGEEKQKTTLPCVATECNQSQSIILSLDTQIHFSWVHGKTFLYISARCLTWGLNQRNLLAEKLQMQNPGMAVQVLPSTNTDCLKIVTTLSNCKGKGKNLTNLKNICKLKNKQWEPLEMEIRD